MHGFCDALEQITFPNSLTRIPNAVCYGCPVLKSVQIGPKVEHVGHEAFGLCVVLNTFISATATPPALGNNPFEGVLLASATLTVPTGSRDAYLAQSVWKEFGSVSEQDFSSLSGLCPPSRLSTYRRDDNLCIVGTADGGAYILYDIEGHIIRSGLTNEGMTAVSLSPYSSGLYILFVGGWSTIVEI